MSCAMRTRNVCVRNPSAPADDFRSNVYRLTTNFFRNCPGCIFGQLTVCRDANPQYVVTKRHYLQDQAAATQFDAVR